jgi:hypothetical protein
MLTTANSPPHRDSQACRAVADEAKKLRRLGQALKPKRTQLRHSEPRPATLGGHVLAHTDGGWRCTVCKRRTNTQCWKDVNRFLLARCEGSAAIRWAEQAAKAADLGTKDGGGHRRMLNTLQDGRTVLWCITCGQYAAARGIGLAQPCKGKPVRGRQWRWGSLNKLLEGKYPYNGERFTDPPSAEDPGVAPPVSTGIYEALDLSRRRKTSNRVRMAPGLRPSPITVPGHHGAAKALPSNGSDSKTASEKMAERLQRIRAKEKAATLTRPPSSEPKGTPPSTKRAKAGPLLAGNKGGRVGQVGVEGLSLALTLPRDSTHPPCAIPPVPPPPAVQMGPNKRHGPGHPVHTKRGKHGGAEVQCSKEIGDGQGKGMGSRGVEIRAKAMPAVNAPSAVGRADASTTSHESEREQAGAGTFRTLSSSKGQPAEPDKVPDSTLGHRHSSAKAFGFSENVKNLGKAKFDCDLFFLRLKTKTFLIATGSRQSGGSAPPGSLTRCR